MRFKTACLQTNVQESITENLKVIAPMLARAGEEGAKLISLPENSFQMVDPSKGVLPQCFDLKEHPGVAVCAEAAQKYQAYVLIGSIPTHCDDDPRLHNTQLLIDEDGEIIARYAKIHLFDVDLGNGESYGESKRFAPGKRAVVANTALGRIGLSICYDLRFPQLYRALAKAGADILVAPAAFTAVTGAAHWHVLNRARAIEHGCFVISAAQTGTHPGNRQTYGHSLIVNPWGEVLADGGTDVGVIYADIDLAQVAETRSKIPSLTHDREFDLDA